MAYDGKLLAKARMKLNSVREENNAEKARRERLVYARIPEILDIDMKLRRQMAELMGLILDRSADAPAKIKALEDKNLALQARRAELLVENGYPMDYLDEIYNCKKCRDTGVSYGQPCSCIDIYYNKALTEELGTLMRTGSESFERFDLTLYPTDYAPELKATKREYMQAVFDTCKKYAANFSKTSPNLLFSGGTGLGKTYLSACIARVCADRGFSVCYDTASAALEAFETSKFSRDAEAAEAAAVRVKRMLDCDLMILDDLGTEMITQMSVSALYTLINTRLVNKKPTIISTNLTKDELPKKYTPQISSRILGEFLVLPFVGNDIRLMKKEK